MRFSKQRVMRIALSAIVVLAGCVAMTAQQEPAKQAASAAELRFKAPAEWITEKTSSNMRVAQYKLPKTEDDSEDASLVLYFFGSNQGGSVQANLERWVGQIEQPDGSASESKAKKETLDVNQLKLTTIDLVGTYTAETAPGSGVRQNKPNFRLRAAVIETPRGAYYVKLVGPTKTVNRWDKAFAEYIKSFEYK